MYAIVEDSGTQIRVAEGDEFEIDYAMGVLTLVLDESPHVKNLLTAPDLYYEAVRRRVGDFRSNSSKS